MTKKTLSLDDMFNEVEAEALARSKKEQAEEEAAWNALPEAERIRIMAEREARIESMFDAAEAEDEEEDEDEDEEDNEG